MLMSFQVADWRIGGDVVRVRSCRRRAIPMAITYLDGGQPDWNRAYYVVGAGEQKATEDVVLVVGRGVGKLPTFV